MAQNLVMRQLDERQTEQDIRLLVYSPKMDILALGQATGVVSLYHLQWQRIWSAAPAEDGRLATALVWRPDGKVLAAGDSSGLLTVRYIEASTAIHTQQLDSTVTCLAWLGCLGHGRTPRASCGPSLPSSRARPARRSWRPAAS